MNYTVEMGSGAITQTKSRKDRSRHSKVVKGYTQTHRQHGDCISLILFFLNTEITLLSVSLP
jgi:hypothetical protein